MHGIHLNRKNNIFTPAIFSFAIIIHLNLFQLPHYEDLVKILIDGI